MEQFLPKHYSKAIGNDLSMVCIAFGGQIVLSNELYKSLKFMNKKTKFTVINPFDFNEEYCIIFEGREIQYSEFIRITNSVSVVSLDLGFAILLSDGRVLFIIACSEKECYKKLNNNLKDICVEYLFACKSILFFYSKGSLYRLKRVTEIEDLGTYLGYMYACNTLLLLNSNLTITNLTITNYKSKWYCRSEYIEPKITDGEGASAGAQDIKENNNNGIIREYNVKCCQGFLISEINSITITEIGIFVLFLSGNIVSYTENTEISVDYQSIIDILKLKNVKELLYVNKILFVKLNNNNIIHADFSNMHLLNSTSIQILENVDRILLTCGLCIVLHVDSTISLIPQTPNLNFEMLNEFFTSQLSALHTNNIKEILKFTKLDDERLTITDNKHCIIFISDDNKLKILNIKTFEYENLNLHFMIGHIHDDLLELDLIEFGGTYI